MNDSEVDEEHEQTPQELFRTAVGVEAGLGFVAIVLGLWLGPDARQFVPTLEQVGPIAGGVGLGVLATIPLLAFISILRRIDHPAVRELEEVGEHPLFDLLLKLGPVELLVISICAGVGEELLFRGWFFPAMSQWLAAGGESISSLRENEMLPMALVPDATDAVRSWWSYGGWLGSGGGEWPSVSLVDWWSDKIGLVGTMALLLSSLAFGFVHRITNLYVIVTGLMGLYFGLLLILTGNLLIPIVAHALYDAIQLWGAAKQKAAGAVST